MAVAKDFSQANDRRRNFLAAFELKLDLYTLCILRARTLTYTRITRARTCECFNYLFRQRKVLKLSATSNKVASLLKRFTESDTASKYLLQEISITTPTYE